MIKNIQNGRKIFFLVSREVHGTMPVGQGLFAANAKNHCLRTKFHCPQSQKKYLYVPSMYLTALRVTSPNLESRSCQGVIKVFLILI